MREGTGGGSKDLSTKMRTGGRVSGNETLACFVVSGRRTASGGFVQSLLAKLCRRLGLVLSSSLEGFPGEWVEGEREVGRKVKMQRRGGEGSRAQRVGMPSQLSLVTGLRPSVAELRNTTPGPLVIPPPFCVLFLFPSLSLHSPAFL